MMKFGCKAIAVFFGAFVALPGCIPEDVDATDGAADGDVDDGGTGSLECPDGKVLICHVPPGNPDNAHEICIGEPAVRTHLARHGDWLGPCDPEDGGVDGDVDAGDEGDGGDDDPDDGGMSDDAS